MSIGIGLPNVSIGINLPLFPELVPVPGYPVYYAPRLDANYFFYDGMYWVYQNDNWYASSWYNGPWGLVDPEYVPLYILRIPVRYYRQPPSIFAGGSRMRRPAGASTGAMNGSSAGADGTGGTAALLRRPPRCPSTSGSIQETGIPEVEQQQTLRSQHYRYQPRDTVVRQHFKQQDTQHRRLANSALRQCRSKSSSALRQRRSKSRQRAPAVQEQNQQRTRQRRSRSNSALRQRMSKGNSALRQPRSRGNSALRQRTSKGNSQLACSVSSGRQDRKARCKGSRREENRMSPGG